MDTSSRLPPSLRGACRRRTRCATLITHSCAICTVSNLGEIRGGGRAPVAVGRPGTPDLCESQRQGRSGCGDAILSALTPTWGGWHGAGGERLRHVRTHPAALAAALGVHAQDRKSVV